MIEESRREDFFGLKRERRGRRIVEENRCVKLFGCECGFVAADLIGDDDVDAFAMEFGEGVFDKVVGFRGKCDDHLAGATRSSDARDNIGVFNKGQCDVALSAFSFLCGGILNAIVRNRCGADDDVRVRRDVLNRLLHLGGGFDGDCFCVFG